MITEELKALPKVELHCHLDGSLSHTFIEKRLGRKVSQSELSVSEDCRSLNEYLQKFDLPGKCLMDEAGLQEAGYDVLRSMKQENVCYAEIRFAPLLSETQDMNCNKVIEALLNGLERGKKDFGIEYGVITCAMRHHSQEDNSRMIKTAREYLGYGVCAADLAGAEAAYPMAQFMELFQNTRKLEMPFTIHAGECGSVQNIVDAVKAGAGRIGHGIAMRGHYNIQKELADRGIGIEMCPISNLQTKAVNSPSEYPIREFLIELGDQRRYHICGEQRTCSYSKISCLQTRQVIDVILHPLFDLGNLLRCLDIYFSNLCKLERCCTSVK